MTPSPLAGGTDRGVLWVGRWSAGSSGSGCVRGSEGQPGWEALTRPCRPCFPAGPEAGASCGCGGTGPGSLEGAAHPASCTCRGATDLCPRFPSLSPTGPCIQLEMPSTQGDPCLGPGGDRSFWGGRRPPAGGAPPSGPAHVCTWVMLPQGLGGDEINSDSLSAGGQAGLLGGATPTWPVTIMVETWPSTTDLLSLQKA